MSEYIWLLLLIAPIADLHGWWTGRHFGVKIGAAGMFDQLYEKGTPVKATADGTVIFSGWTTETGYVIILKHSNNYISVYKHNGNLLKEQGDFVKSGEVIATVGSTGELTIK